MNIHGGLPIDIGGKHFLGARWDGGIPSNQRAHHPTHGFDAQGQRGDIEQ